MRLSGKTENKNRRESEISTLLGDLLQRAVKCLTQAGVYQPRMEAEMLIASAVRLPRYEVHPESGRKIDAEETVRCTDWIDRRAAREPAAYILGRREFWSLEFKVTPAVLIPRPETEILIELFLEIARKEHDAKPIRVLDVGTGSGNIAVVVAKELPLGTVTALDISSPALEIAMENARRHGVLDRIQFVESDLWNNLTGEDADGFDFILSNPPYIDPVQFPDLMTDVRDYEPRQALLGGSEGLEFYRRLLPGACDRLRPGGFLLLEIGMNQAEPVTRIIQTLGGFETPAVFQDYSGRDRVMSARKSSDG